jgi:hypothetical protein
MDESEADRKQPLDKKAYMKTYNKMYYQQNKETVNKMVAERKKLVRGSDAFRAKLVEELNNGTRKFVKAPTKERLNLQQDPKTLKWS